MLSLNLLPELRLGLGLVLGPALAGVFRDADEEHGEQQREDGEADGEVGGGVVAAQGLAAVVEGVDLHCAGEAEAGAHAVAEQGADEGTRDALVLHGHGVAGDDLGAGGDEVDGEGGEEHGGEGHGPVGQVGGDGGQEHVDDGDGEAAGAHNGLGGHAGHEPGGEEGVGAAHERQRQVLHPDPDQTVAADRLHVDVHVPEVHPQAHEGEQRHEHQHPERRRFPDVEGEDRLPGHLGFPKGEARKQGDGQDQQNDLVRIVPPGERCLAAHVSLSRSVAVSAGSLTSRRS